MICCFKSLGWRSSLWTLAKFRKLSSNSCSRWHCRAPPPPVDRPAVHALNSASPRYSASNAMFSRIVDSGFLISGPARRPDEQSQCTGPTVAG